MTMVVVNEKDYDAKILDIKSKYITTADSNKFFNDVVANRIKSEGLANLFYCWIHKQEWFS